MEDDRCSSSVVFATLPLSTFVINRENYKAIKLSNAQANDVSKFLINGCEPEWIRRAFDKLDVTSNVKITECAFIGRNRPSSIIRATWEVTTSCNYDCHHCYLGELRGADSMSYADMRVVIDKLYDYGCVYLQMTGGEPLLSPDFCSAYRYAYDKGFLITVLTNGFLLGRPQIVGLFAHRPPQKIAISLYGIGETYDAVTNRSGSFSHFREGLERIKSLGVRIGVNIVAMTMNSHQIREMEKFAREYSTEVEFQLSCCADIFHGRNKRGNHGRAGGVSGRSCSEPGPACWLSFWQAASARARC